MGKTFQDLDFDASYLLDMMDEDVISYEYHIRGLEKVTERPSNWQYSTNIEIEYENLDEDAICDYFRIDQYDDENCEHEKEVVFKRLTNRPLKSVEEEIKYDMIEKFIKEKFFDLSIDELERKLNG